MSPPDLLPRCQPIQLAMALRHGYPLRQQVCGAVRQSVKTAYIARSCLMVMCSITRRFRPRAGSGHSAGASSPPAALRCTHHPALAHADTRLFRRARPVRSMLPARPPCAGGHVGASLWPARPRHIGGQLADRSPADRPARSSAWRPRLHAQKLRRALVARTSLAALPRTGLGRTTRLSRELYAQGAARPPATTATTLPRSSLYTARDARHDCAIAIASSKVDAAAPPLHIRYHLRAVFSAGGGNL